MRELGQVVVVAWQVVRLRDGSIVSFGFFRTEADALESVGLEDLGDERAGADPRADELGDLLGVPGCQATLKGAEP
jgi:hypothetical protein